MRDIRLKGEENIVKCREGRLGIRAGALKSPPDAAPQINFVAEIERRRNGVRSQTAKAGLFIRRNTLAHQTRLKVQGGQQFAARHARGGAGLVHAGKGGFEFLIGL